MKTVRIFLISFFIAAGISAPAQDHIYSQFYNSPIYLNPALNGQFQGDVRLNLIYRDQWTSLPGKLNYMTASLDFNIPQLGGGLGLMFTRSTEGTAYLTKNNLSGIYSYSVGNEDFALSFGLQPGLTNRRIDWNKLVFSDQIDPRLGYIPGSSTDAELPSYNNKYFIDISTGLNLVYRHTMVGAGFQHINQPDESFTGTKSLLPMRTSLYASYLVSLGYYDDFDDEGYKLIPSVVVYRQKGVNSISGGFQFKRRSINAGLWFRSGGEGGPDALVLSFIFDLSVNRYNNEKLRIGLSHDATTSKLNYSNTSGTSEVSLGYSKYFPNSYNLDRFNGIRCYDFY